MDTTNLIKITGVNLVKLVKTAYDLSRPQGLGFLHFTADPLTDAEAESLIDHNAKPSKDWGATVISMDYVKGRSCKFYVLKDINNDLWIKQKWYDHSPTAVEKLLEAVGISQ